MGRRNKAYYKDLHQQAYDKLVGMQAFGESKRAAVAAGTDKEKIFSFNTYKSYWKHTKYFIQYIQEVRQRVAAGQGRPGAFRLDGTVGGQGHGKAVRYFS